MVCKECGSKELQIITVGPHNKLLCSDCLTFQKFVSFKELESLRKHQTIPRIEKEGKLIKLIKELNEERRIAKKAKKKEGELIKLIKEISGSKKKND